MLPGLLLKPAQIGIVCLPLGGSGETQHAPPGVVGGVPGDGDEDQRVPTLHVVNLSLYRIERRLLRAGRDAEAGIDHLDGRLRHAVGAAYQQEQYGDSNISYGVDRGHCSSPFESSPFDQKRCGAGSSRGWGASGITAKWVFSCLR